MMLNKELIREKIIMDDLVTNYIDLETQLQPNGFDLTIEQIYAFPYNPDNEISFDGKKIDNGDRLVFDSKSVSMELSRTCLQKGVYKFKINETIKLPNDICAITTQRSSFMRMGNTCNVGFWDLGYHGSGYSIMQINNPVYINANARVIQMYFYETYPTEELYKGIYQKENVRE